MNRLALFLTQIVFSIITPLLLMPRIGNMKFTRSFIAFCFGKSYGNRYDSIIDSFQGKYGLAMAEGLAKVKEILQDRVNVVADCGTGTGFVTKQASEQFSNATFIAFDILENMIRQARTNCKGISTEIYHVQADTFKLPLANDSIDILLVQNTMPCFTEFARVCKPGGICLYVDSSSGWVTETVKNLIRKNKLFKKVIGEKVEIGFWVLAQKASEYQSNPLSLQGKTDQEKMANLLRCPLDHSKLVTEGTTLSCEHNHKFPIYNGFPVMLENNNKKPHG